MTTINAINGVFERANWPAMALDVHPKTKKRLSVVTDTYISYPVIPRRGVNYRQVATLLPELQDAVGQVRKQRVKLRFGMYPFSLEVPRRKPEYMELDATLPGDAFTATIGRAYTYGKLENVTISFADPNEAHCFIAGMIGCGKSNTLESMLSTLTWNSSPDMCKVYAVDMKRRSIARFADLPHIVQVAYDEQGALSVVKRVFDEMLARRDGKSDGTRVFLFVDELRELMFADGLILGNYLPRIVALGREFGVHVVAATQKPSAKDLGHIVNAMFPVRIAGVVEDAVASFHALKRKGAGAESLIGRGDMLISKVGAEPIRMQTYLVNNPAGIVNRAVGKWGARKKVEIPHVGNAPEVEPESAGEELDRIGKLALQVKDVYASYLDENGELRRGGMQAMSDVLYGVGVQLAGSRYRDIKEIAKRLANG